MTDPSVRLRVQVSAELAAMTRANILGHVAGELAAALPAVKATDIKPIIFGFREAILSRVEFLISSASDEVVGYMAIEIDWRRFSVAIVEESSRNVFQIDPKQPVTDQVAPLLARARSYIQQACKEIQGAKCEPIFSYRDSSGEEAAMKRAAFNKKYALRTLSKQHAQRLEEARLNRKFVAVDGQLPEMTITFKSKKIEP